LFVLSVTLATNEQGLALLGYSKDGSRQLKLNNYLKVEDKNKKPNSITSCRN
jgi:hypothetical protein